MATLDNEDLKNIKILFEAIFDEKVESLGIVTQKDISHLPTKDEFYEANDKLIKELKDSREEQTILGHQVSRHGEEMEIIRQRLQINPL